MASDKIVTITDENFERRSCKSEMPVLVDFWATWCGPCRMVAPMLDELADEMDGKVRIAKLNVDENQQIAYQFQVSSIPTFILFKDGQMADRMMGAMPKAAFQSFIDRNLPEALGEHRPAPRPAAGARRSSGCQALLVLARLVPRPRPRSLRRRRPPRRVLAPGPPRRGAAPPRLPHPHGARRGGGDRPRPARPRKRWTWRAGTSERPEPRRAPGRRGRPRRWRSAASRPGRGWRSPATARPGVVQAACAPLAARGLDLRARATTSSSRLRKRKTAAELAGDPRAPPPAPATAIRAVARLLAAAVERDGELWLEGERADASPACAPRSRPRARRGTGLEQPRGQHRRAGGGGGRAALDRHDERVLRARRAAGRRPLPARPRLFADCTRTFCVGEAPEALAPRPRRGARRARARPHAAARARACAAGTLQEAVCGLLRRARLPDARSPTPAPPRGYVHGLGHGVGFELHEYPSFRKRAGAEGVLARGRRLHPGARPLRPRARAGACGSRTWSTSGRTGSRT